MKKEKIYYSYFSRDCDMCECSYCSIFEGTKKSFIKMVEKEYEQAEGTMYIHRITEQEYKEWEEMTGGNEIIRDRTLEAFENGHAYSVFV